MINYLRHMAVFAQVVDEGSFRAAAKKLGVAPSRVSETVSDLEQYLGTTLLYRSTRKLSLTSEGEKFYRHVAHIVRNAEAGMNELNAYSQEPKGELSVSLPAFLATSTITSAVAEFLRLHPKVSISLTYTDQVVDLINSGIDLSIRAGWPKDSAMMSRKLAESHRVLVASKTYMESHPTPTHANDLADWDWIRFQMRSPTIDLVSDSGEFVSLTERSRISANSAEALTHLALQHLGVTILPEHLVKHHIESGELVQVLPQWQLKPIGYYALWPDTSRRENLTLLLVRFLADHGL